MTQYCHQPRASRSLACLAVAILLSSCSVFSNDPPPYANFEVGGMLFYRYVPAADEPFSRNGFTIPQTDTGLVVQVFNSSSGERANLSGRHAWQDRIPGALTSTLRIFRYDDGLREKSAKECNSGIFDSRTISFVRVPSQPRDGDRYPQFACGSEIEYLLWARNVGRTTVVPAGTFTTFDLVYDGVWREIWAEDFFPVKYELLGPGNQPLGSFELFDSTY